MTPEWQTSSFPEVRKHVSDIFSHLNKHPAVGAEPECCVTHFMCLNKDGSFLKNNLIFFFIEYLCVFSCLRLNISARQQEREANAAQQNYLESRLRISFHH